MLITNEKYESVIKKITLWSWWVCKGTENVLKYTLWLMIIFSEKNDIIYGSDSVK